MVRTYIAAGMLLLLAMPALAQESDDSLAEIVVTAMRRDSDDDRGAAIPVIGVRRRGDFLVQTYQIVSDTREPTARRDEVYATLLNLLNEAGRNRNIQISVRDDDELRGVTKDNYRAVPLAGNWRNRSDTSYVSVYVKHRLSQDGSNAAAATTAIESFAKTVKVSGRAEVLPAGDTEISIINPQQYRQQILDLVAKDSLKVASLFGPDYGVDFSGFTAPIQWIGESPTEVFLYIRYSASIRPKRP
jgi:hypothetical protein